MIESLMRRARSLRRQILALAVVILAGDVIAADEFIRLLAHPTVRITVGLACAVVAVGAAIVAGLRIEKELVVVRGECARRLASGD